MKKRGDLKSKILGRLKKAGPRDEISDRETAKYIKYINSILDKDERVESVIPLDPGNPKEFFRIISGGYFLLVLIDSVFPNRVDRKLLKSTTLEKSLTSNTFQKVIRSDHMLSVASDLGCTIVGIDGNDIAKGQSKMILAVVWQLIRVILIKKVKIAKERAKEQKKKKQAEGEARPAEGGAEEVRPDSEHEGGDEAVVAGETPAEEREEAAAQPEREEEAEDDDTIEQSILSWVNNVATSSGVDLSASNLHSDFSDGRIYLLLIRNLLDVDSLVEKYGFEREVVDEWIEKIDERLESDDREATSSLAADIIEKMNITAISPSGVEEMSNPRINLAFTASLYENMVEFVQGTEDDTYREMLEETVESHATSEISRALESVSEDIEGLLELDPEESQVKIKELKAEIQKKVEDSVVSYVSDKVPKMKLGIKNFIRNKVSEKVEENISDVIKKHKGEVLQQEVEAMSLELAEMVRKKVEADREFEMLRMSKEMESMFSREISNIVQREERMLDKRISEACRRMVGRIPDVSAPALAAAVNDSVVTELINYTKDEMGQISGKSADIVLASLRKIVKEEMSQRDELLDKVVNEHIAQTKREEILRMELELRYMEKQKARETLQMEMRLMQRELEDAVRRSILETRDAETRVMMVEFAEAIARREKEERQRRILELKRQMEQKRLREEEEKRRYLEQKEKVREIVHKNVKKQISRVKRSVERISAMQAEVVPKSILSVNRILEDPTEQNIEADSDVVLEWISSLPGKAQEISNLSFDLKENMEAYKSVLVGLAREKAEVVERAADVGRVKEKYELLEGTKVYEETLRVFSDYQRKREELEGVFERLESASSVSDLNQIATEIVEREIPIPLTEEIVSSGSLHTNTLVLSSLMDKYAEDISGHLETLHSVESKLGREMVKTVFFQAEPDVPAVPPEGKSAAVLREPDEVSVPIATPPTEVREPESNGIKEEDIVVPSLPAQPAKVAIAQEHHIKEEVEFHPPASSAEPVASKMNLTRILDVASASGQQESDPIVQELAGIVKEYESGQDRDEILERLESLKEKVEKREDVDVYSLVSRDEYIDDKESKILYLVSEISKRNDIRRKLEDRATVNKILGRKKQDLEAAKKKINEQIKERIQRMNRKREKLKGKDVAHILEDEDAHVDAGSASGARNTLGADVNAAGSKEAARDVQVAEAHSDERVDEIAPGMKPVGENAVNEIITESGSAREDEVVAAGDTRREATAVVADDAVTVTSNAAAKKETAGSAAQDSVAVVTESAVKTAVGTSPDDIVQSPVAIAPGSATRKETAGSAAQDSVAVTTEAKAEEPGDTDDSDLVHELVQTGITLIRERFNEIDSRIKAAEQKLDELGDGAEREEALANLELLYENRKFYSDAIQGLESQDNETISSVFLDVFSEDVSDILDGRRNDEIRIMSAIERVSRKHYLDQLQSVIYKLDLETKELESERVALDEELGYIEESITNVENNNEFLIQSYKDMEADGKVKIDDLIAKREQELKDLERQRDEAIQQTISDIERGKRNRLLEIEMLRSEIKKLEDGEATLIKRMESASVHEIEIAIKSWVDAVVQVSDVLVRAHEAGWLHLLIPEGGLRKKLKWKRVWCVLQDNLLIIANTVNDVLPEKVLRTDDVRVYKMGKEDEAKYGRISLFEIKMEDTGETYVMAAASEDDKKRWCDSLVLSKKKMMGAELIWNRYKDVILKKD